MPPVTVKTLAERRVRRQKQFIAVGTVVLLAVLGFQLPKLLGGKGGSATAIVTSTSATAATTSGGAALVASPSRLPDTDRVVVERDPGQLLSFGLFRSKDPFVQQLTTAPATTTPAPPPPTAVPAKPKRTVPAGGPIPPAAATTPATAPTAPAGGATTTTSTSTSTTTATTPGSTGPATTTTPGAPPLPPNAVLLSTNGVCEQVAVNGTFPLNEDIFRLVSIAKDRASVEIGVVGGSYDSGQATATAKLGTKLTLVNTADGTRYVIVLERRCAVVHRPGSSTATTTTTPAPATTTTPAAPLVPPGTTTATTPIVTDAYDTTTPSP